MGGARKFYLPPTRDSMSGYLQVGVLKPHLTGGERRLKRRDKKQWKEEILSFQTGFSSSPGAFTTPRYGPVLLEHILEQNAFWLSSEKN